MKLNKEQLLDYFLQKFPELREQAQEELAFYEELLGHVIFPNLLFNAENLPDLRSLLKENQNPELIQRYCEFLEKIYTSGDDDCLNILVVSILELLSDDEQIWFHFWKYISNDFIRFINTDVLVNNLMMTQVPCLPYHKRRNKPEKH